MARNVQAASRRLPSGIALRVADYEDASALKRALAGIDDMVLISSDGDASAVMRHHANAIEAATATNIRHITFTSIVDTDELSPFYFSPVYRDAERRLAVCGVPSTILSGHRPGRAGSGPACRVRPRHCRQLQPCLRRDVQTSCPPADGRRGSDPGDRLQERRLTRSIYGTAPSHRSCDLLLKATRGVAIAVVSSRERKRRQPGLATDDPAFVGWHQLVRGIQGS